MITLYLPSPHMDFAAGITMMLGSWRRSLHWLVFSSLPLLAYPEGRQLMSMSDRMPRFPTS